MEVNWKLNIPYPYSYPKGSRSTVRTAFTLLHSFIHSFSRLVTETISQRYPWTSSPDRFVYLNRETDCFYPLSFLRYRGTILNIVSAYAAEPNFQNSEDVRQCRNSISSISDTSNRCYPCRYKFILYTFIELPDELFTLDRNYRSRDYYLVEYPLKTPNSHNAPMEKVPISVSHCPKFSRNLKLITLLQLTNYIQFASCTSDRRKKLNYLTHKMRKKLKSKPD